MNISDLLKLPPGVTILFVVMIWPAIWAAVSLVVAFAGDVLRHDRHASHAPRKAA